MSKTIVNVNEAHFSKPLEQALNNEEIVFAKSGQSLVKPTPLRPSVSKRPMGFADFTVEANFDERSTARMDFEWRESARD